MKYTLSAEVIEGTPESYDFGENYISEWELALSVDEDEQDSYMPMMNFLYPLPEDFEVPKDAKKLMSNMTIVYLTKRERYYLALTGGGMDMTWDIVETYINLGFYPPTHFCRLPAMAGMNFKTGKYRRLIVECNKAMKIHIGWLKSMIDNNRSLTKRE